MRATAASLDAVAIHRACALRGLTVRPDAVDALALQLSLEGANAGAVLALLLNSIELRLERDGALRVEVAARCTVAPTAPAHEPRSRNGSGLVPFCARPLPPPQPPSPRGRPAAHLAAPGTAVSAALVEDVIAAAQRDDDDVKQSALDVVSAFRTPKFTYDTTRRAYDL